MKRTIFNNEQLDLEKALFLAEIGSNQSIYKNDMKEKASKKELLEDMAQYIKDMDNFLELEKKAHTQLFKNQKELNYN